MTFANHIPDKLSIDQKEALGQSEEFLEFQEKLSKVAPINRPVLIMGERGTGKELAASRIHYLSKRWQNRLITLNCSALSPSLIESELFGHERGSFTGAEQRKEGRFEAANKGTLFLDEIGTVPIEVQEKILRVVEYGTFERVGNNRSIEVDVRIIAATNADLAYMAEKGSFKEDLLDRLSFEVLFVPPLRERKEDIMLLANHFASRMAFELEHESIPQFSQDAVKMLTSYMWPGNIRELKNVVERAVYRSTCEIIKDIDFDPFRSPFNTLPKPKMFFHAQKEKPEHDVFLKNWGKKSFNESVWEFKIYLLEKAMKKSNFNQKRAAKEMGLTYNQFRGIYRKYLDYSKKHSG